MIDNFLTNRSDEPFLTKIKEALKKCTSFKFSVSFIKKAGLILFQKDIEEALERGARGQIITSSYQNFTDISSLETFNSWQEKYKGSFSCHFDFDCFGEAGFHSKGYIFENKDSYELIVGSSNITRFALLNNIEWDVSLFSKDSFPSYLSSLDEFDRLWEITKPLNADLIKNYQIRLAYAVEKWDMDYISSFNSSTIRPNFMQKEALKDIRRYRDMGADKALIIAATGSGKTYLAAFDALNFGAKRLLYVVHREQILEKARESFIDVFGSKYLMGLFTGKKKELDADFIFATNSELSNHLYSFDNKEFDYIVLDECHHSTADSYQKIIKYFQPEFLLGLTATPNRMDNQDVLSVFDKNVPYQLSIADALNNDLIVPFKYYAIRDEFVDYSLEKKDQQQMIRQITSPENCRFIDEQIRLHAPNGKLKAIGFCRSVQHAAMMKDAMDDLGYKTVALVGKNDTGSRIKAFDQLADDKSPLQIIFAVDILNEGIDLPAINMVLFLRPTESQTIFIQQLGRGLRKYPGKEYLTVLDFIGNSYQRSVQIALALSSLKTDSIIEKPSLYQMVNTSFSELNLPVQIFFDEKSKKEILSYIERTNFNRKDFLISDYKKFKEYLHLDDSFPKHIDYLNNSCAPNILRFINSSMNGKHNASYYTFLKKAGETALPIFNNDEISLLEDLSALLPLVRPDDFVIFQSLLGGDKSLDEIKDSIKEYESIEKPSQLDNAIKFAQGKLFSLNDQSKRIDFITEKDRKYHFDISSFSIGFIDHLKDLLTYGLERFKAEFGDFEGPFKLYGSYSTAQFCMSVNLNSMVYMKGTLITGNTGFILAGLKKDASVSERLNYADRFLSPSTFQWESETGCTFTSNKGLKVLAMKEVDLFVRKVKVEDGITLPFIYVGKGKLTNPRENPHNPGRTIIFDIQLEHSIAPEYRLDLLVPETRE